jgi:hypothetical protein
MFQNFIKREWERVGKPRVGMIASEGRGMASALWQVRQNFGTIKLCSVKTLKTTIRAKTR